jgi:hypothetical protein
MTFYVISYPWMFGMFCWGYHGNMIGNSYMFDNTGIPTEDEHLQ